MLVFNKRNYVILILPNIGNGYVHIGAGEASADVPEGEEDKAKDDDAVAEGIAISLDPLFL